MIDPELVEMLRCPETQAGLQVASDEQLERVNAAIKSGKLKTADGRAVSDPVAEGLITVGGERLYRIDDGIPVVLADDAIMLQGLE